jgi:hypothetical protein
VANSWPALLSSRKLLFCQLGLVASFVAAALTDVVLVKLHTSCATYHASETARGLWALVSIGGAGLLLLGRLAGFAWLRRLRPFLLSLGILAAELALCFAAVSLVIEVGLFYCAFQGLSLSPCLLGCAH